jgi:hypothetical protein
MNKKAVRLLKKWIPIWVSIFLLLGASLSHAVTFKRDFFLVDNPSSGHWVTTPYFHDGRILIHYQPKFGTAGPDFLIDLVQGQPWQGHLESLLNSDARPLDLTERVIPDGLINRADLFFDEKRLVDFLGCSITKHDACTPLTDEGVLIFRGYVENKTKIRFDVVDVSGFLTFLDDVLAGRVSVAKTDLGLAELELIDILAERKDIVDRWMSALRTIQSIDQLRRAAANAKSLQLYARPYFAPEAIYGEAIRAKQTQQTNARPRIDLNAVYELTFFKIQLSESLRQWQKNQQTDAIQSEMARLIQIGSLPPFQTEIKDHMVDVVTSVLDPDEIKRLSGALLSISRQTKSGELSCFSGYIRGRNCQVSELGPDQISPPNGNIQSPLKSRDTAKKKQKIAVPSVSRTTGEKENSSEPQSESVSSAAAVEVARINQLPNKAVLFSYDESTGQLSRETASLGGLTFTAKSLGIEPRWSCYLTTLGKTVVSQAY